MDFTETERRSGTGLCEFEMLRLLYQPNQPRDKSAKTTKGLQRSPQPLGFLVAGAGFEPATFGL